MPRVAAVPADDYNEKTFEYEGQTFRIKNKFKIFKFFKELNQNPVTAMELVIEPEDFVRLEELEIDMDDFKNILEEISQVLSGDNSKN